MARNAADFVQHVTAALPHGVKFQTHSNTRMRIGCAFATLNNGSNIAFFILFLSQKHTRAHTQAI